jgi:toxin FitB
MVMYLLDTNVVSVLRRPERAPDVVRWVTLQNEADVYLSVLTLGEIERGIAQQEATTPDFAADLRHWLDQTATVFADRILPFDAPAARLWGRMSAKLGNARVDVQIAATALVHGAVVVTGDAAFAAMGVRVENPFGR